MQLIGAEFDLHGGGVAINAHENLPVVALPVIAAPTTPTNDKLVARLEAGFAVISADETIDELEAVGAPCDEDFWA